MTEEGKEGIRQALDRILASPEFAHSMRISRFLRRVVEHALAHPGEPLKEYVLGVEVFDRPESYDPRVEPIVRVEARRLRAKLKRYYETAGAGDSLRITLPTGAYLPRFEGVEKAAAAPRTLAVLPFTNLSAEPETEYFSDGLTEELIHALTRVPNLRVVAWHSMAQLKDMAADGAAVTRQVHADTLVRGSVRRFGERLRITAQLIDAASGVYLWSEGIEGPVTDLFALQDRIAGAILQTLGVARGDSAIARPAPKGPAGIESYQWCLKGRFHWNKRTPDGLLRSIECFQQAVAIHPGSAIAYSGLADAYSVLTDYGLADPADSMPKARQAALRALELDPSLGEAYASLGFIESLHRWQWEEAGRLYRKAIALSPGYATGHHWFGIDYLAMTGRFPEAQQEVALALELDPLSLIIHEGKGYVLMLQRRYAEARRHYLEVLDMEPSFYKTYTSLARVAIQSGEYREAVELLEKGRSMAGDGVLSIVAALGQAHGYSGNHAAARETLAQLHEFARTRYVHRTSFALVHIALGETAQALDWLDASAERREISLASIGVHPIWDPLRGQPRMQRLLERTGLLGILP